MIAPRLARAQRLGDREHRLRYWKNGCWPTADGRRPLVGDQRLGHGRLDDRARGPHERAPSRWSVAAHPGLAVPRTRDAAPEDRGMGSAAGRRGSPASGSRAATADPLISLGMTSGSTCRSRPKLRWPYWPFERLSRIRSISTSPMVSEIHFAACGSLVRRKILVAGCESIASASWPYRVSSWLRPWNAEHDRIVRLPVFRDGGVELRQPLQARELVEDEPHGSATGLSTIHQPQHQHVEPQARERHEACPRLRRAREEQPPATIARPRQRHSIARSSPILAEGASAYPPPY